MNPRSRFAALVLAVLAALTLSSSALAAGTTRYIVQLDSSVEKPAAVASRQAGLRGAEVGRVFRHALKGYTVELTAAEAAGLRQATNVVRVEADRRMHAFTTQTNATWGLDRTDQRTLPLSTTFTYTATGAGVTAYIIDTGIKRTHNEFGGRAVFGFDSVDGTGLIDDCNGHGTHVAGTVGGATYGLAKQVRLVAVRVLDCAGSGFTSGVIAGVDWVTGNHEAGQPAVANMSLGGGVSATLDAAVQRSIADGVSYAIAAGNGDTAGNPQDACTASPARVPEAMTIGATDSSDRKASFSNLGSCVDWFAPGVGITSAWFFTNSSTNTISGTSMATPHAAGVAALYLQGNPTAAPAAVRTALFDGTTKDSVIGANSANDHLLFTNY